MEQFTHTIAACYLAGTIDNRFFLNLMKCCGCKLIVLATVYPEIFAIRNFHGFCHCLRHRENLSREIFGLSYSHGH